MGLVHGRYSDAGAGVSCGREDTGRVRCQGYLQMASAPGAGALCFRLLHSVVRDVDFLFSPCTK